MVHLCRACDIEFDSAAALDVHKRKFCPGASSGGSKVPSRSGSVRQRGESSSDEEAAVRERMRSLAQGHGGQNGTLAKKRERAAAGGSAPAREGRAAGRERGSDAEDPRARSRPRASALVSGGRDVVASRSAGARRDRSGGDRDDDGASASLYETRSVRSMPRGRDRERAWERDDPREPERDGDKAAYYDRPRDRRGGWPDSDRDRDRGNFRGSGRDFSMDGRDGGSAYPWGSPAGGAPNAWMGMRGSRDGAAWGAGGYGPAPGGVPSYPFRTDVPSWQPGGGPQHMAQYGDRPMWSQPFMMPASFATDGGGAYGQVPPGLQASPLWGVPGPAMAMLPAGMWSLPPGAVQPATAMDTARSKRKSGHKSAAESPAASSGLLDRTTTASDASTSRPASPLAATAAALAPAVLDAAGPPPFGSVSKAILASPAPLLPPDATAEMRAHSHLRHMSEAVKDEAGEAPASQAFLAISGAAADGALGITNEDTSIALLLQLPREVLETEYVQQQLKHLLELREMRIEAEKLKKQRELEVLRSQVQREKDELSQQAAHEAWLAQQKRIVREARIRKALAKELGDDIAGQLAPPGASALPTSSSLSARPQSQYTEGSVFPPTTDASPNAFGMEPKPQISSGSPLTTATPASSIAPGTPAQVSPATSAPNAPSTASSARQQRQPPTLLRTVPSLPQLTDMSFIPAHGALEHDLGVDLDVPALRAYDPVSGLHIMFDFATGLPPKASKVQVAYCFYVGEASVGAVQALPAMPTEADTDLVAPAGALPYTRCMLAQQRIVDGDAGDDVALVVELQRVTDSDARSIGWTTIPLFRALQGPGNVHTCFGRYMRLPLFKPPVAIHGNALDTIQPLVPLKGSLHVRMYTHAQYSALVEAGRVRAGASIAAAMAAVNAPGREDVAPDVQRLLQHLQCGWSRAALYESPQKTRRPIADAPLLMSPVASLVATRPADASAAVAAVTAPSRALDGLVGMDVLSCSLDAANNVASAGAPRLQLRFTVLVDGVVAAVPRIAAQTADGVTLTAPPASASDVQLLVVLMNQVAAARAVARDDSAQMMRAPSYDWDSPASALLTSGAATADAAVAMSVDTLPIHPLPHRPPAPGSALASHPAQVAFIVEMLAVPSSDKAPARRVLWCKLTLSDILGAMCAFIASLANGAASTTDPAPLLMDSSFNPSTWHAVPITIPIGLILPIYNTQLVSSAEMLNMSPDAALPDPAGCTVTLRLRCTQQTLSYLLQRALHPPLATLPLPAAAGSMRRGLSTGSADKPIAPVFDARSRATLRSVPSHPSMHVGSEQQASAATTAPRAATPPGEQLAWCDVTAPPPPQVPFDPSRDVFDIHVDAARFLSDNVTVTKAVVKVLSSSFKAIGMPLEGICDLNSSLLCPTFHVAGRFLPAGMPIKSTDVPAGTFLMRTPGDIDPTCTLVIRIDTLESHTHASQVAGYALLNLFSVAGAGAFQQPTPGTKLGPGVVLNDGAFQLPLMQAPPAKSAPLQVDCLSKSPRVPCATVLVRIRRADGQRASAPFAEAPRYATQAYDSTRCRPQPAEVLLYPKRAEVPAPSVHEFLDNYSAMAASYALTSCVGPMDPPPANLPPELASFGVPPPRDGGDAARLEWCMQRLAATPSSMLNFQYLAPYDASMGFKVRVDAVHQLPAKLQGLVKVLHCINPPGSFYNTPADTSSVYFTQQHDWTSSVRTQLFRDGYAVHVGLPFDPLLLVVFDVKVVVVKKSGELGVESLGWGVLPLFDARGEGYVNRGAFVIPLMEGSPTKAMLDMFRDPSVPAIDVLRRITGLAAGVATDAASGFLSRRFGSSRGVSNTTAKAMTSFVKDGTSLLVRMHDGQLTGVMGVPASAYSTMHVPPEVQEKYEVGATTLDALPVDTTPLTRIVPKKLTNEDFEAQANTAVAQALGLNVRAKQVPVAAPSGMLPLTSVSVLPAAPVGATASTTASAPVSNAVTASAGTQPAHANAAVSRTTSRDSTPSIAAGTAQQAPRDKQRAPPPLELIPEMAAS